ncbi:diaminopimelate epimerase [Candidatus Dependentiae bacterium]|nr:diaminopimelate epimerase [Candidatus Dependentiae bacterium]
MLTHFFKYQSLGNDFIVFDWYKKPQQDLDKVFDDALHWSAIVRKLCDRNFGVGADGVLIIKNNHEHGVPEMLIFNSDGSQAQSCLNGVRCIAQHLVSTHRYPEKFSIKLSNRLIECVMSEVSGQVAPTISTSVGTACYKGTKGVQTTSGFFSGHIVDVGNPHFIIFQNKQLSWLEKHGSLIEQHELFPNKTNVEFVWQDEQDKKKYYLNVYERGCGVTRACSSGAAAFAGLLKQLGMIDVDEQIIICMPGGAVAALVQDCGNIILQASAVQVFQGTLPEV